MWSWRGESMEWEGEGVEWEGERGEGKNGEEVNIAAPVYCANLT